MPGGLNKTVVHILSGINVDDDVIEDKHRSKHKQHAPTHIVIPESAGSPDFFSKCSPAVLVDILLYVVAMFCLLFIFCSLTVTAYVL